MEKRDLFILESAAWGNFGLQHYGGTIKEFFEILFIESSLVLFDFILIVKDNILITELQLTLG